MSVMTIGVYQSRYYEIFSDDPDVNFEFPRDHGDFFLSRDKKADVD